jgi:ribosomal protein S18 acetylase RimI-like enzyme
MIAITPITLKNVAVFKAVRLRALQDAPDAFSSTYAKEAEFPDSEWLARAERMNGKRGAGFVAMDGEMPCGLVGGFLDENDASRVTLVSMWTAPSHRREGVGRRLVDEVLAWAAARNAQAVFLLVTGNNHGAIRFYERLGFSKTGITSPYPNDPAVIEYEMYRAIRY